MEYLNDTHERAVTVVKLWLDAKDRVVADNNEFRFPAEFIKKHKLGTPSRPNTKHSFDIYSIDDVLIEVDDYEKHSKKNQKINDGIINDYVENHLTPNGYRFYRLQKEEIVDDRGRLQEKAAQYLKENLF